MSLRALTWAWGVEDVSSTQKLVLLALADHKNEQTGRCDPSVERIARRTCLSERAVRGALAALADRGLIVIERRVGTSSRYLLAVSASEDGPALTTERRLGVHEVQGGTTCTPAPRARAGRSDESEVEQRPSPDPLPDQRQKRHAAPLASTSPGQAMKVPTHGWRTDRVFVRTLDELGVGDKRFPDLEQVLDELLADGVIPDSIYEAARQLRRGGVQKMRSARYLAAIVRSARPGMPAG